MNLFRIALANVRFPSDPEESVAIGIDAVARAADGGASIVCFPECYVPGYREGTYHPGTERHLFRAGPLAFGIVICHEGWRYPETVRWAARRGAHRPARFADPLNTFHEKAERARLGLVKLRVKHEVRTAGVALQASPGDAVVLAVIGAPAPHRPVRAVEPDGVDGA